MKIAIVGDIHQSVSWKKIIDSKDEYDKIIFLGDEFDTWNNKWPLQMINAENIIAFKNDNPEKVDLCWSNHAISYYLDEGCSGYQMDHAPEIKSFYIRYRDLYNVAYVYDNWLFSHAGVSAKWMQCCGIKTVYEINQLFRERPDFFRWVGPDGFGNNPNEGPLWIRPPALMNNRVNGYNQVAGHTEMDQPGIMKKDKQIFVFCDTPSHNYLTVVVTESDSVKFICLD